MFDWDSLEEDESVKDTNIPEKQHVEEDVSAEVEVPEPMAEPMAVTDLQNISLRPVPESESDNPEPPAAEPMVEPVSDSTAMTETTEMQNKVSIKLNRAAGSGDLRQLPCAAWASLYSQFGQTKEATAPPTDTDTQTHRHSVGELISSPQDEKAEPHPPERRCCEAVNAIQGLSLGFVFKCTGLIYQMVMFLFYHWSLFFHAYDAADLDKLPDAGTGGLIVVIHSTHNADILTLASMVYMQTGRAPSLFLYGRLCQFLPFLKILGFAFSSLEMAVEVLRKGGLAVMAPGGVAEALIGHENAYSLHPNWETCCEYAHMAKEAGVKIYPCFTQNADEMRFNPLFWLANKFWFGKIFDLLSSLPLFGVVAKWEVMQLWFPICWTLGLPIPVKLTTYFGKPVETDGLSEDQIAKATKAAMADLVKQHQPHGHAYLPGLRRRVYVSAKTFSSWFS